MGHVVPRRGVVDIIENWSRMCGRVEAWTPPRKPGQPGTLTLLVDRVDDVVSRDGSPHRNLLRDRAGTTVDIVVPASVAGRVRLKRGSLVAVDVRCGPSANRLFAHPERITLTP